MTPADIKAKATELIHDAIRTAESAYAPLPAPFADRDAQEAKDELTAFVDSLIECAIELKGVVDVDSLLAKSFDAQRYAEVHKTYQRRKAILSRLEERLK